MDIYVQCCNLVSEDINNPPDLRKLCIIDKQSTSTTGDESMRGLGNTLSGILHISGVRDSFSGCVPALERREVRHQDKENVFDELDISRAKVLVPSPERRLSKCATFPCSGKMLLCSASMNMNNEMIPSTASAHRSLESEITACSQSTSLPTPSKLVSAMKGSRAKYGAPPKDLTVTWAHDVYDPPATSMSHSVKSHNQQRSRSHKKNGKQKHKGKSSSRTSSNNKKQYRKIVGSSNMGSKSMATCNRFILDGFDNHDAELVDFAVTGQDSKCGSSFLMTSLTKVHISVTEAT